jgi:hypothetical protein
MRILSTAALAAVTLAVAVAASASAQSAPAPHKKIFGYQDAQTGTFHPLSRVAPDTTTAPTTGKFAVVFHITVDSSFPSGSTILCGADVDESSVAVTTTGSTVTETVSEHTEEAFGSVAAGAVGSVVVCQANIPYSWLISASSTTTKVTTTLNGGYTISAYRPASSTISESSIEALRISSSELAVPAVVPATGATTTIEVTATI